MGFHLNDDQLRDVFDGFKRLADKKKEVYDGDLAALIKQTIHRAEDEPQWSLVSLKATSGTGIKPHVRLTLKHGGQEFTEEVSEGDGPIDAAFWATEKITGLKLVCREFVARSDNLGTRCSGRSHARGFPQRQGLPRTRRLDGHRGIHGDRPVGCRESNFAGDGRLHADVVGGQR